QTDCSVRLALEGFNTTGFNKIVAQKTVRLKKGQQTRIVLTGQFTDNNIPEVRPVLHLLKPGQEVGGTVAQTVNVYDMFFRTSDDAKAIYPIHGYASLKRP